jgi:catechol 2,3-dioxygenase-like lactoylglutathione lyase family enzyme
MEARISVVTLGVDDPVRALSFYRDGLGLPVRRTGSVLYLTLPGAWIALHPRAALAAYLGAAGTVSRATCLAWNVDTEAEVRRVLEAAEAAGAVLRRPPLPTTWGGYAGVFEDPDGHLWEVVFNPTARVGG